MFLFIFCKYSEVKTACGLIGGNTGGRLCSTFSLCHRHSNVVGKNQQEPKLILFSSICAKRTLFDAVNMRYISVEVWLECASGVPPPGGGDLWCTISPLAVRHDICQIFYTSTVSQILKFTREKARKLRHFSLLIWKFGNFIHII